MPTRVNVGASVTMTAAEADQYAGNGAPHVVSIDGVSFLVGVGIVGFSHTATPADLVGLMAKAKVEREDLAKLAKAEPKRLYSFLRM